MAPSKVTQGTFHQGNAMFSETAGRQCSCCYLVAICFSLIKGPAQWDKIDLDIIIKKWDEVYKSINTTNF